MPSSERERYRIYAYHLLPTLFHESGEEVEHPLARLTTVPISDESSRLGYDAVARDFSETEGQLNISPSLGCSPL